MSEILYRVPFDTNTYPIRISQGRGGPWSHFVQRAANGRVMADLENAVDFALPLGTAVQAARSGRILGRHHESNFCYEGLDPEVGNNMPPGSTNYVSILHSDMTVAIYSHLSMRPAELQSSQVLEGDVIGFTGKSGWIAEIPHLHFQVWAEGLGSTLPVLFANYDGPLVHEELERLGLVYYGGRV